MATDSNYLPLSSGRVERIADDVVAIYSLDGPDFVRICVPHRWASTESVYRHDLPKCPHCELGTDDSGHRRFSNVQLRLMPVEAQA